MLVCRRHSTVVILWFGWLPHQSLGSSNSGCSKSAMKKKILFINIHFFFSPSKPVGVLAGHSEGITHIDSRGDGRYLISNGKVQSKMNLSPIHTQYFQRTKQLNCGTCVEWLQLKRHALVVQETIAWERIIRLQQQPPCPTMHHCSLIVDTVWCKRSSGVIFHLHSLLVSDTFTLDHMMAGSIVWYSIGYCYFFFFPSSHSPPI